MAVKNKHLTTYLIKKNYRADYFCSEYNPITHFLKQTLCFEKLVMGFFNLKFKK